jgi:hypothetical protein
LFKTGDQTPVRPSLEVIGSGLKTAPEQIGATGANVGILRHGVTVIVLKAVMVLPHASVAFHVSVMVPPQGPGAAVCVEVVDPLIKQVPLNPLE